MMISSQQELERLLVQFYVVNPKERTKGAVLPPGAQKIMTLIMLVFHKEMITFAGYLANGLYEANDAVQEALTDFMHKAKWQSYNEDAAGETGVVGWYRQIYKNSIRDAHRAQIRYLSRNISLDGNWWESDDDERKLWVGYGLR